MKTASIREVRHDFNRILGWVADGEEVAITRRRKLVARLLPATRKKRARGPMPDVTARLHKVFGRKVIADAKISALLAENRGPY
jgi:antitoxin (DNA-binding transcriptional repressor) of toxin-antitoxin stability system